MKTTYTAVLTPSRAGGWVVEVPALPGCLTQGETVEEALTMAEDAVDCYLGMLLDEGKAIPADRREITVSLGRKREAIVRKVTVSLPAEVAKVA